MKKPSLAWIILKQLEELKDGTLDAFFPDTYSYTRIWRPLLGLEKSPRINRRTVSMGLWRLQQQGLVQKSAGISAKKSVWRLTANGEQYIIRKEKNKIIVPPRKRDGIIRLVIFDIPERERRKRDAIRAELIGYNFRQLQKSVWIGDYPLPKDFIDLIDMLELGHCVHILGVRQFGTIPTLGKR